MSCFPEGDGRNRVVHAHVVMIDGDYSRRIKELTEVTGACLTCAKNVCSDALCKFLITVFLQDYPTTKEEAEKFEKGIIALCNSLIEKHIPDDDRRGHSSFTPSDN